MVKINKNEILNVKDDTQLAVWECGESDVSESLYVSHELTYYLHVVGSAAIFRSEYGEKTHGNEDLIVLDEEDVFGWLATHAPDVFEELTSTKSLQDRSAMND